MLAWRHHFAALFGLPALARVRGFSAPEMHLPIHPDVCFAYVRALRECGYRWLMVQEHTVENPDGTPLRQPRLPHRLVARNSEGDTESITVLVKTQGSDTKLVGQMQPFGEAKSLDRQPLAGHAVPPYAVQIGDGENGGVMMNEFPSAYQSRLRPARPARRRRGRAERHGVPGGCGGAGRRRARFPRRAAGVAAPHLGRRSLRDRGTGRRGSGHRPPAPARSVVQPRPRVVDQRSQLGRGIRQRDGSRSALERPLPRALGPDAGTTPAASPATSAHCCICCCRRPAVFATGARATGPTWRRRSAAAGSSPWTPRRSLRARACGARAAWTS